MARYSVTGRTVLITGSTGGPGAALSQELRARAPTPALLDLEADAVATQAKQLGGDTVAAGFAADVRDMSRCTRLWTRQPLTSGGSTSSSPTPASTPWP